MSALSLGFITVNPAPGKACAPKRNAPQDCDHQAQGAKVYAGKFIVGPAYNKIPAIVAVR